VIGGVTAKCTELAALFYRQFMESIISVSSPEAAEMITLLDSTFLSVNTALATEMAFLTRKLGVNLGEVIDASKTKPYWLLAGASGANLTGCNVPMEPYFLTWKSRMSGFRPRLVEVASEIIGQLASVTIERVADALNEKCKSLKSSRVLALGLTSEVFDIGDFADSIAMEILRGLHQKGARVFYSDPRVASIELGGKNIQSLPVGSDALLSMDCIVLLADYPPFDEKAASNYSGAIVDCRSYFRDMAPSTRL
jgi:UDP-N-acetyl-D-glucosamine dehydrogenase